MCGEQLNFCGIRHLENLARTVDSISIPHIPLCTLDFEVITHSVDNVKKRQLCLVNLTVTRCIRFSHSGSWRNTKVGMKKRNEEGNETIETFFAKPPNLLLQLHPHGCVIPNEFFS